MARKKLKPSASGVPIESVRHKNKRTNIPTQELRGFVEKDEHAPKTVLYPRDPSLDPQLVWKGKDEQDSQPLSRTTCWPTRPKAARKKRISAPAH